jgi:hypothetical protein
MSQGNESRAKNSMPKARKTCLLELSVLKPCMHRKGKYLIPTILERSKNRQQSICPTRRPSEFSYHPYQK